MGPGSSDMAQLPFALPPQCAIQVAFNKKAHTVKQFSDLKRTCNGRLQSMYNMWQMETQTLKDGHSLEIMSLNMVSMSQ